MRPRPAVKALACAVIGAALMLPARAQKKESGDWPSYGRDPGAQRFRGRPALTAIASVLATRGYVLAASAITERAMATRLAHRSGIVRQ